MRKSVIQHEPDIQEIEPDFSIETKEAYLKALDTSELIQIAGESPVREFVIWYILINNIKMVD